MTGFLVKRLAQALVVLLLVSVIVFVLLHMLPGGPARAILGVQATPQSIAHFNHQQGYDRSLPQQYVMYLGRLLSGDLGESYKPQPVGGRAARRTAARGPHCWPGCRCCSPRCSRSRSASCRPYAAAGPPTTS